jgi:transcription antitermination factor NusG
MIEQNSEAKTEKKAGGGLIERSDARPSELAHAWIVVITKAGQERIVHQRLSRTGFEVYLPMRLASGPKKGSYPAPFFPRHLFARATLDAERWHSIFTTVGISRVLCSPQSPIGVRDEFIHKIREREVEGYLPLGVASTARADRPARAYKRGEKVTSLAGFVDLLFDTAVDERRVSLLASGMGDSGFRITANLRKSAVR